MDREIIKKKRWLKKRLVRVGLTCGLLGRLFADLIFRIFKSLRPL